MSLTTIILSLVGLGLILIAFFIWIIRKIIKKRKKKKDIPLDVLDDYELAEKKYYDNGGMLEHHKILWDIAKSKSSLSNERREKQNGRTNTDQSNRYESTGQRGYRGETPQTGISRIPTEFIRRQDIPSYTPPTITGDQNRNREPERNNHKRLFRRR